MVDITFTGYEELNTVAAQLRTTAGRVGGRGAAVVRRSANQVEALAKLFCPVDTGNLRSSIGPPVITGDGRFGDITATVSATAEYAFFVEFGTSRMAPAAFMGPALDRVGPDFAAAVEAIADPLD